mgnify:CR=1 FL=1
MYLKYDIQEGICFIDLENETRKKYMTHPNLLDHITNFTKCMILKLSDISQVIETSFAIKETLIMCWNIYVESILT